MQLNEDITFREHDHTYWNTKGEELISCTTLLHLLEPPFDPTGSITRGYAAKVGMTTQEVREMWNDELNKANEFGTAFHKGFEDYINGKEHPEDLCPFIKDFEKQRAPGDLQSESVIADNELLIAGTIDLIFWTGPNTFSLGDFKTNKKLEKYSPYGNKMFPPLNHFYACNFNTYTLQLNLYRYLLERKGFFCEGLEIYYLNRSKQALEKHEVQILNDEIELVIDFYNEEKEYIEEQRQLGKENISL